MICKYLLEFVGQQDVNMPQISKILSIQLQNGKLVMWAETELRNHAEYTRMITAYMTGEQAYVEPFGRYIATIIQPNGLVWHFYDTSEYAFTN